MIGVFIFCLVGGLMRIRLSPCVPTESTTHLMSLTISALYLQLLHSKRSWYLCAPLLDLGLRFDLLQLLHERLLCQRVHVVW